MSRATGIRYLPALARRSLLTAFAVILVGCSSAGTTNPAPQPCDQQYSVRRCLAMADQATQNSDETRDDVASILIVPIPPPPDDGILRTLGGAPAITVRLVMLDGSTREAQMCMGLPLGPACSDEPPDWVTMGDLIGSGYHDVPCAGESAESCATPVPLIDPTSQAAATPIRVPSRSIPLDHVGGYEVVLGTGSLPNGVLTRASYHLPDPWSDDVTFTSDAAPRLVLRSLEPDGKPFFNVYEHGWRDGLERIEAVLVFEVKRFDPGATVEIADVVVR